MVNFVIFSGLVGFVVFKVVKTLFSFRPKENPTNITTNITENHLHVHRDEFIDYQQSQNLK